MNKIHLINYIFLITFSFSNQLEVKPLFFTQYSSSGSDWIIKKSHLTFFGSGLSIHYNKNNWKVESTYLQLGIIGDVDSTLFYFSPKQSLPYLDKSKEADGSWSELTTAKISYAFPDVNLEIGKFDRIWGYGVRSIHLSNRPPSYPQFGFEWAIKPNLTLFYFHGTLRSGVIDSTYKSYYGNGSLGRSINTKRSIAGHRIEWQFNKKLTISANETVVYALRGIDFHYMIPVIPFYPVENYLGDTDNLQIGFDLKYEISIEKAFYLSFFMDELTPEWLLKRKNHNWFAWQLGFNSDRFVNKNINWGVEYNWTDQRIYKHKFIINDFYSHDQPLGFWAGPHAQELLFFIKTKFNESVISMYFSSVKRGSVNQEDIENNYKDLQARRFDKSFDIEEKKMGSIKLERSIFSEIITYQIELNYIEFKNKLKSDSQKTDIKKASINLGLFYNFSFF